MWESREVRIDLPKISWLRPSIKSGANLFIGPTLPHAMLRFWCAQYAFLKKARVCPWHALLTGIYLF